MKRSGPLRRGKPLAPGKPLGRGQPNLMRRTRLAPRSQKRIAETPERRAVVAEVVARDGHWCQAADRVPEVKCWGPLDADEYEARSAHPGSHLDPSLVQMLCRAHHSYRHEYPIEAAHRGLRPYPVGYTGPRVGPEGHESTLSAP